MKTMIHKYFFITYRGVTPRGACMVCCGPKKLPNYGFYYGKPKFENWGIWKILESYKFVTNWKGNRHHTHGPKRAVTPLITWQSRSYLNVQQAILSNATSSSSTERGSSYLSFLQLFKYKLFHMDPGHTVPSWTIHLVPVVFMLIQAVIPMTPIKWDWNAIITPSW